MNTQLTADELNDFIGPSPECIKPVQFRKSKDRAVIEIGADGVPTEDQQQLPVAQISLSDCLACSGCITSSESILVEQQSVKELMKVVQSRSEGQVFVASVAPQVRVSLAQGCSLTVAQVDSKLRRLLHEQLGFKYVVGTEIGRAISLEMSVKELAEREATTRPIITSVCPGWTCYVEKSKPEMIPYLSTVRSPQQITGNILKRLSALETGVTPKNIYHVSIMPCFDKKLEASRLDYTVDGAKEVDMVITARELVQLCNDNFDLEFAELPESSGQEVAEADEVAQLAPSGWPAADSWKSNYGSTSGGYLTHIVQMILNRYPGSNVQLIPGRNRDVVEHVVSSAEGTVIFRGAQVYGFRNIQNVVRKLKPTKGRGGVVRSRRAEQTDPREWHYIEIMACPGGCGSGGGQLTPVPDLQPLYNSLPKIEVNSVAVDNYLSQMGVELTAQLVTTKFEAVKNDLQTQPLALSAEW